MTILRPLAILASLALAAPAARAADLGGSPSSMVHQHEIAVEEDYSFTRTPAQVAHMVDLGSLVRVEATDDYTLSGVSFPYARPAVRDFVARFAAEFRDSTGTRLVVTSLTRPTALQPRNAHVLSVHPAGMAVDFRVPADATARAFLERRLLALEKSAVLDVTRERRPAHYHVAVFPEQFATWAARMDSADAARPQVVARLTGVAPVTAAVAARDAVPSHRTPWLAGTILLLGTAPAIRWERRRRQRAG